MAAATTLITISSLSRITSPELAGLLADPDQSPKIAVIDVRDSDHIGGHIRGSSWIPTDQLDMRIPELIRMHANKDKVVFHCMLSQQRGPASALKFARALQQHQQRQAKADGGQIEELRTGENQEKQHGPDVCVLEGGFGVWQARYGTDERLTEAYAKDLWD